jgi:hypothetical protein
MRPTCGTSSSIPCITQVVVQPSLACRADEPNELIHILKAIVTSPGVDCHQTAVQMGISLVGWYHSCFYVRFVVTAMFWVRIPAAGK